MTEADDAYVGVDPAYQNHALDVDAPLDSDDPEINEMEQRGRQYVEDMTRPPAPPVHPNDRKTEDDSAPKRKKS